MEANEFYELLDAYNGDDTYIYETPKPAPKAKPVKVVSEKTAARIARAEKRASVGIVKVQENSATVLYYHASGERLSISKGNSKLAGIPQFNLTPVESCRRSDDLPCKDDCYAVHLINRYPSTKRAWARNLAMLRSDLQFVMAALEDFLTTKEPKFFRFHTSGDFDNSQEYVDAAIELARKFPKTKFMAYTKIYELDFSRRPANMTTVLSQWSGWNTDAANVADFDGQTFVQDGKETRIKDGTYRCPGSCEKCRACWLVAKKPNMAVYFDKHAQLTTGSIIAQDCAPKSHYIKG